MALGTVVGPGQTYYRGGRDLFASGMAQFQNEAIQRALVIGQGFVARAGADVIATAVRESNRIVNKQLLDLERIIRAGIAPQERQAIHERIGRKARDVTVARYKQTLGNSLPGYRSGGNVKWRRYSGGRMLRALQSPRMYEATPDGLSFINVDHLSRAAAQWARLNFGAGSRGTGSLPRTTVRIGNLIVASLGLDEPARPAFTIPRGYWLDASGQLVRGGDAGVQFHLPGTGPREFRGKQYRNAEGKRVPIPFIRRQVTRGFPGRNFLDAGVRTIALEMGPAYQELFRELAERGETTVRPRPWTFKVKTG